MENNGYYSAEFNSVMKRKTPNILKWGWFSVGILFSLIIISCYVIQYPNTISYEINLNRDTTVYGYSGIILFTQGKDSLFVYNQPIQIKLSKYSYLKYGTIEGYITNIQYDPKIKKKVITVIFPKELLTSKGQNLSFEERLSGYYEMIVGKERLVKKIFSSL